MKKRKVRILFTSIIASMFLTVSSCGGDTPSGHTHSWSTSWSSDETYHWHKCTGCDAINDKIEHTFVTTVIEPDYDHQGYTHHECSICEYSYNDHYVDPLEHHYSSTWSKDESAHWHACIDEGYETLTKDYALHDFGEWIIDVPATEEHDGTRHHVCNTCSYSHSESYKYVKSIAAERVYLANPSNELFNGYTYSLSPVVVPYDANKNIKYEVEHPELMTVADNVALATGVGSTLLYVYNDEDNDNVRDDDEAFTVISFNISEPETSKSVTVQESATIKVGETKRLQYSSTGIPNPYYGYYTEDPTICTISDGIVKGHRPGSTRISISCKGYRAYCNITVENYIDGTGLRAYEIVSEDDFVMNKGESKAVAYDILPSGSVDTLKSVESNNEAVVKVNADKSITALKGGTARIKLTTTNNKYAFTLIAVKDNANLASSYYNNYYGNLTWENSEDLISKLHTIISTDVTPLAYGGSHANWETNQKADQDLFDHSYVDCVYTDANLLKTNTNSGWQREHAFCASLMTGYSTDTATSQKGRATDFHNLFAAGGGANSSRKNKCLGYARPESQEIESKENCIYDNKTFEPADEDKGRLARAIMYMTVMYNGENSASFTESSQKVTYNQQSLALTCENVDYSKLGLSVFLSPTDSDEAIVNYYYSLVDSSSENYKLKAYEKYLEQSMPYAIGNAEDIIEWGSFPVNYVEYQHNNSVYSDYSTAGKGRQGNRNPFVDYPELIEYAFGELKDEPGSLSMLTPTYLALEMDKDEIHHYSVESDSLEAFESGTKPTVDDFNIKAIKNNLTEGTLDKSKIIVEDYTFTDDDVENGKVIEIYTDKNTLKVPCKVTSESVITFDTCTWNHIDNNTKDHDKGCYGTFNNENVSTTALFSGLSFTVSCGNTTDPIIISNSTANGTKIGTGTSAAKKYIPESVTFETNDNVNFDGKTKVNAVYAIASTAANKNYNYEIFIGGTLVKNGTFTGTNIELSVLLPAGQEVTGKVKIVFSNVSAAINIRGLAINAIA